MCLIFRQSAYRKAIFCLKWLWRWQARPNFASMKQLLTLLMIGWWLTATAQMTLNDCLVYARDHARSNEVNALRTKKAQADVRMAASEFMPSLSVSSSGNLSFGRNIDPETNTYDNKRTLYTGFGVYMSLPVFDGLVNINNLRAAKVGRLRRLRESEIERDRISLEVVKTFYNVSYCKAMVEQITLQLRRDSADLAATEKGYLLGNKSGADRAEMRSLVASDEYELANQRNLLSKAYIALRSTLGMDSLDQPLEILETSDYQASAKNATLPRILDAELAVREGEYTLRAARGKLLPTVSLNAGVSTSYYKMIGMEGTAPGFRRQWHDNMGEYVGFSVSIPLFSGLYRVNAVKKARLDLAERRIALEQTRYEIERETTEAQLDLTGAEEELRAAIRRLDAEQTAYNAVRRRFELGDASAIDLYTSGAKLATARASYEGARIRSITGRIILDYYLGGKLINE